MWVSQCIYDTFLFDPMGRNPTHVCSVNKLSISNLSVSGTQMIHLLKRSKVIPYLINASELHSALEKIAKFISLSIFCSLFIVAADSQSSNQCKIRLAVEIS